jgi:hypothetical protein
MLSLCRAHTPQSLVLVKSELAQVSVQDVGRLLADARVAELFVSL